MIGLVAFAVTTLSLTPAPLTCAAHAQGGEVLPRIMPSSAADAPYLVRGKQSLGIAEGTPLCADDVLVDPATSPYPVSYRLAGQQASLLQPGQTLRVPAPTILNRIAEAAARFDDFFGDRQESGTASRGGRSWKSIYPLPAESTAVPGWGPLIFAWSPATDGNILVENGASSTEVRGHGFISLNVAHDCPKGCSLTLSFGNGQPDKVMRIHTVDTSQAPKVPMSKAFVAPLTGTWLLRENQDPQWRVQAASLLWHSACDLPAIDQPLRIIYRLDSDPDVCNPNFR